MLFLAALGLPKPFTEQNPAPNLNTERALQPHDDSGQLVLDADACPPGCEDVTPGPTIHGDPMFKINGTAFKFDIPKTSKPTHGQPQCGGSGCSSNAGGSAACCTGTIRAAGVECTAPGQTRCLVP